MWIEFLANSFQQKLLLVIIYKGYTFPQVSPYCVFLSLILSLAYSSRVKAKGLYLHYYVWLMFKNLCVGCALSVGCGLYMYSMWGVAYPQVTR